MEIPRHVAIILDGNGRWAKKHGMPRNYGHTQGAKNVETICRTAWDMGIKYLTVYAFSTENWARPKDEVNALMKLLRNYMKNCIKTAEKNHMRVRIIGDKAKLDQDIQESIRRLEELNEQRFESYLDTEGIPAPDLLIRTSGEQRLSNYLLWQLAYSELYFTDVAWPDFTKKELEKAIQDYNNRNRRFGGIGDAPGAGGQ